MDFNETPVTFIIIAINALVSIIGFSDEKLISRAIMWPYGVKRYNQYYRFISSGFIHADWLHLFFNMFTFFFFGTAVEYLFSAYGLGGKIAFIALYLLGLIASDIPTYIKHRDDYNYHCLGASGAVSAVVFAAVIFDPWSAIYLYGALKISMLLYAILYIWYCIYMSKRSADNINHDAHLWGALFGFGFTVALIAAMNPELFSVVTERLKNPSLLGR